METSPQKDCAAPHFRGYVDTLVSVHKQRLRILISHCKWPEGKNTAFFIPHCCFGGQNKRRQTFQSLVTNFAPDTTTLSHYFYNDKKKKNPKFCVQTINASFYFVWSLPHLTMGSRYGLGSFVSQINTLKVTRATRLIFVPKDLCSQFTAEHRKISNFTAKIPHRACSVSL